MGLFGSSGIRSVVNKELILLAFRVGLAVGSSYRRVVIGCDTRTSATALKHAFISGLVAGGSRAFDARIVPTPTLAYAAREFDAGVMITASHNPPEYNGIKLWNPDGSAFNSAQRKQIEKAICDQSLPLAPWEEMERCDIYPQAVEGHMERVLGGFPEKVRVKAVVDCGCGAASVITPQLLKRMGADVVALNCHTSGFPPRGIEPNDENLKDLAKVTRGLSADLGIAHDGDADRMMVIDDEGRFVPGDKLLAIFSREMGARKVITNADASMAIEELGFEVVRTRVGDAFVSQELKGGGDFGGEPSGSWVFPAISYCPDGIYAAAKITQIASRAKLSRLVDELPSYFVLRGSVPGEGSVMADLEQRLRHLKPVSVNTIDGVRLVFEDGWLLVRASGTEPKVRITAEAKSEGRAEELYREGERALKR